MLEKIIQYFKARREEKLKMKILEYASRRIHDQAPISLAILDIYDFVTSSRQEGKEQE